MKKKLRRSADLRSKVAIPRRDRRFRGGFPGNSRNGPLPPVGDGPCSRAFRGRGCMRQASYCTAARLLLRRRPRHGAALRDHRNRAGKVWGAETLRTRPASVDARGRTPPRRFRRSGGPVPAGVVAPRSRQRPMAKEQGRGYARASGRHLAWVRRRPAGSVAASASGGSSRRRDRPTATPAFPRTVRIAGGGRLRRPVAERRRHPVALSVVGRHGFVAGRPPHP